MKNKEKKTIKFEYTVNEVPPFGQLLLQSIQHFFLIVVSLSLPILLASQISTSIEFTNNLLAFSMLAAGIGSIIQSVGLPFIGSGYLCPNVCGPSYFSLSLSAAWIGGMPLMRGMIIFAGAIEMLLAPLIQKLKSIFPGYVVGIVVAMIGVSVIKIAVASFFGLEYTGDIIVNTNYLIATVTLLTMVFANVWGNGFFKTYCLIIGMLLGWGLTFIFIPDYINEFNAIKGITFFAFPSLGKEFTSITFDYTLLIPFLIIALSGSLKSFGNLLAAQNISEPELKEVNFTPIRKGLLADGFSTLLAGVIGGMAVDTSSSNIGLAGATKVTSRWISVGTGVIVIILAFFPKFLAVVSLIPKPVLGASIIFAGSFMIIAGLREMFNEKWNNRKTFVIGISLFFGLSTSFLPELYARAPEYINEFFTDPLPTTSILAVILHQLLNLDVTLKKLFKK